MATNMETMTMRQEFTNSIEFIQKFAEETADGNKREILTAWLVRLRQPDIPPEHEVRAFQVAKLLALQLRTGKLDDIFKNKPPNDDLLPDMRQALAADVENSMNELQRALDDSARAILDVAEAHRAAERAVLNKADADRRVAQAQNKTTRAVVQESIARKIEEKTTGRIKRPRRSGPNGPPSHLSFSNSPESEHRRETPLRRHPAVQYGLPASPLSLGRSAIPPRRRIPSQRPRRPSVELGLPVPPPSLDRGAARRRRRDDTQRPPTASQAEVEYEGLPPPPLQMGSTTPPRMRPPQRDEPPTPARMTGTIELGLPNSPPSLDRGAARRRRRDDTRRPPTASQAEVEYEGLPPPPLQMDSTTPPRMRPLQRDEPPTPARMTGTIELGLPNSPPSLDRGAARRRRRDDTQRPPTASQAEVEYEGLPPPPLQMGSTTPPRMRPPQRDEPPTPARMTGTRRSPVQRAPPTVNIQPPTPVQEGAMWTYEEEQQAFHQQDTIFKTICCDINTVMDAHSLPLHVQSQVMEVLKRLKRPTLDEDERVNRNEHAMILLYFLCCDLPIPEAYQGSWEEMERIYRPMQALLQEAEQNGARIRRMVDESKEIMRLKYEEFVSRGFREVEERERTRRQAERPPPSHAFEREIESPQFRDETDIIADAFSELFEDIEREAEERSLLPRKERPPPPLKKDKKKKKPIKAIALTRPTKEEMARVKTWEHPLSPTDPRLPRRAWTPTLPPLEAPAISISDVEAMNEEVEKFLRSFERPGETRMASASLVPVPTSTSIPMPPEETTPAPAALATAPAGSSPDPSEPDTSGEEASRDRQPRSTGGPEREDKYEVSLRRIEEETQKYRLDNIQMREREEREKAEKEKLREMHSLVKTAISKAAGEDVEADDLELPVVGSLALQSYTFAENIDDINKVGTVMYEVCREELESMTEAVRKMFGRRCMRADGFFADYVEIEKYRFGRLFQDMHRWVLYIKRYVRGQAPGYDPDSYFADPTSLDSHFDSLVSSEALDINFFARIIKENEELLKELMQKENEVDDIAFHLQVVKSNNSAIRSRMRSNRYFLEVHYMKTQKELRKIGDRIRKARQLSEKIRKDSIAGLNQTLGLTQ